LGARAAAPRPSQGMAVPVVSEASAAEPSPKGAEGGTLRSAHRGLMEFAAAAQSETPSPGVGETIPEELEELVRDIARTGAVAAYPWTALRVLLARKMELVLAEHWREAPPAEAVEGGSAEGSTAERSPEPLAQSLLDSRREGPPFTLQRICELLVEPRGIYKSSRSYRYALQRLVLIMATEELLGCGGTAGLSAVTTPLLGDADAACGNNGSPPQAGRKRKLPPELSNGVVCESAVAE